MKAWEAVQSDQQHVCKTHVHGHGCLFCSHYVTGVCVRSRLDFQPFEGVWFSDPPPNNVVCAKERGRTKRLEIEPTLGDQEKQTFDQFSEFKRLPCCCGCILSWKVREKAGELEKAVDTACVSTAGELFSFSHFNSYNQNYMKIHKLF